jgi:hypothetical protein
MWNLILVHLQTVLLSVQDRSTVCARQTIGSEIGPWFKWKLNSVRFEIVLTLMQDRSMVCVECTIGSEIVLDASDGSPR